MVAPSALKTQWSLNLETRGNRLPPMRLEHFRLGSCDERLRGGSGLLVNARHKEAHHLQGAQCIQVSHLDLFVRAQREKALIARRQLVSDLRAFALNGKIGAMICELRKLFLLADELSRLERPTSGVPRTFGPTGPTASETTQTGS